MQHSPEVPTPTKASSSGLMDDATFDGLTEANQKVVETIQKSIFAIYHLYKTLPEKLERFNRIQGLSSMRKDLSMQSSVLDVNVDTGIGGLISTVVETLKRSQSTPHLYSASPSSPLPQGDSVVDGIKSRLDHIHRLLKNVDSLSDSLAAQQDKLSLPIRQRREAGKPKHNQNQSGTKATVIGRVGVTKRRPNLSVKHKNHENPDVLLRHVVAMLTQQFEEFSRECQKLQPAEHDDALESTPIPEDLKLAKKAAVMLCKALCQACPNKNHVHSVLFGLSTQELSSDDDTGSAGVEFNLAFESPGEPETWFVVQSTMKAQDSEGMDMTEDFFDDPVDPVAHARPSFSSQLRGSSYPTAEPNAHFCLQYHKQGTSDLAAALKHSDICEHELFYPDQTRLDSVRDNGQAIPLRQLLEESYSLQQLEPLQKIRIARLLAEAVLKFHSADWLLCEWDWDDVLIYKIDGSLEPHLRFELKSPGAAGKSPQAVRPPRSRPMGDVMSQLGTILGNIAVGPTPERPTYAAVRDSFGSTIYAEIFKACVDMSRTKPDLSDVEVREEFYAKVVAKLDLLEECFIDEDNEYM